MATFDKNKNAVVAFSGGLDTSFCVLYLRNQGYTVSTITVDGGGFSADEIAKIEDRSKALGAVSHRTVNGREEIYERFASYIIKGNILRGGVYPLCVGAERTVQAEHLAKFAIEIGAETVCHGCTGAGNDQVRFDVALRTINPGLKILAPIRELQLSRGAEISYLQEHGINVDASKKRYSINQGILGVTIGGGETHDSWSVPPNEAYLITRAIPDTPDEPLEIELAFERGLPVALNGKKLTGFEILIKLNELGGKHGVGRGMHLGDTILGIKGRIAFEAPGTVVLITAHRELEKLVLTKWQAYMKNMVSEFYGMRLHEGAWFEPSMRDCEALIDSSQTYVSGDVKISLFRASVFVTGCRSEYSLMTEQAMYGEESSLWTGRDAEGFCKIAGLQSVLPAKVHGAAI